MRMTLFEVSAYKELLELSSSDGIWITQIRPRPAAPGVACYTLPRAVARERMAMVLWS